MNEPSYRYLDQLRAAQRSLDAADGFLALGLYDEAQARLDSIPEYLSQSPSTKAFQLRLCHHRKDWEGGAAVLAEVGSRPEAPYREAAGRFLLGMGAHFQRIGSRDEAEKCLTGVRTIWPEFFANQIPPAWIDLPRATPLDAAEIPGLPGSN